MTKLKFAVAALLVALGGLVGSGMALGLGRPARATDDGRATQPDRPGQLAPSAVLKSGGVTLKDADGDGQPDVAAITSGPVTIRDVDGDGDPDLAIVGPNPDDEIPTPAPQQPNNFCLFEFYEVQSVAGLKHHEEFAKLKARGYPVESADVAIRGNGFSPGRALADKYNVNAYPATVLVVDGGLEVARLDGLKTPAEIAAFYNRYRTKLKSPAEITAFLNRQRARTQRPPAAQDDDLEPSLGTLPPPIPRPWETVVRIKIHLSDQEWGFGSGTVIYGAAEESIILTCAHVFKPKGGSRILPEDYRVPISVDLFDGKFVSERPSRVGRAEQDLAGELLACDFDEDLALVRIRPKRILPASPFLFTSQGFSIYPGDGQKLHALGCSHGNDATAWETKVLQTHAQINWAPKPEPAPVVVRCTSRPKSGRSGGGLFAIDGTLVGVCLYGAPNEDTGYYARPEAIQAFLQRHGLTWDPNRPGVLNRVKTIAIHQFQYPLPRESGPAASRRDDDELPESEPSLEPAPARRSRASSKASRRDDAELPESEPILPPRPGRVAPEPDSEPILEPAPTPPVSDHGQRLDALERKLDQVLKAIEALDRGKATVPLPNAPVTET